MGIQTYLVILEADTPPQIMLGQNICGGIVKELKEAQNELLSAAQIAERYNLSVQTVRRKLLDFNQGTQGKFLYSAKIANEILNPKSKPRTGGARRKN